MISLPWDKSRSNSPVYIHKKKRTLWGRGGVPKNNEKHTPSMYYTHISIYACIRLLLSVQWDFLSTLYIPLQAKYLFYKIGIFRRSRRSVADY